MANFHAHQLRDQLIQMSAENPRVVMELLDRLNEVHQDIAQTLEAHVEDKQSTTPRTEKRVGPPVRLSSTASLCQYRDLLDRTYWKLEEDFERIPGELNGTSRELPVSATTGAFDARSEVGRRLMELVIADGVHNGRMALIFIDVNHLGLVNYSAGMQGGNGYLNTVGKIIQRELRAGDLIFSPGGDEFIALLRNVSPETLQGIEQRLVDNVSADPTAREIFEQPMRELVDEYRLLSDMPTNNSTNVNKTKLMSVKLDEIKKRAKLRPSISIGATLISPRDTLVNAWERAEMQAAMVKIAYVRGIGLMDAEAAVKYNASLDTNVPSLMAKPVVLPPIFADP